MGRKVCRKQQVPRSTIAHAVEPQVAALLALLVTSAALATTCVGQSGVHLAYLTTEVRMADNQKAKHGDSQSGQKNDQEKSKDQSSQQGRPKEEGNQGSRFGQGGEGDQKQGHQGQSGKR